MGRLRKIKPVQRQLAIVRENTSKRGPEAETVSPENNEPPEAPNDLNIGERSSFTSYIKYIDDAGVMITRSDSQAIAKMVKIHCRILRLEKFIKDNGAHYQSEKQSKDGTVTKMWRSYPQYKDLQSDEKELRQWFKRFGLDPLSRQDIKVTGENDKPGAFDGYG